MAISRLFTHAADDLIEAAEINAEFNQLIDEVNQKPDSDTTLQGNLNADMVDGYHATTDGSTTGVVVNSGTLIDNLDADTVDGLHASDLQEGAFPVSTRLLFYQTDTPAGWTNVTPTSSGDTELMVTVGGGTGGSGTLGTNFGSTTQGSANTTKKWSNAHSLSTHTVTLQGRHLPPHQHVVGGLNSNAHRIASVTDPVLTIGAPNVGTPILYLNSGAGTAFTYPTSSFGNGDAISLSDSVFFNAWRPPHLVCVVGEKAI